MHQQEAVAECPVLLAQWVNISWLFVDVMHP
jgi:hypothetical protein